MKKLTAEVARKISTRSDAGFANTFQDAVNFIAAQAKLGHNNTFIDGSMKDLKVIKAELEERGFRCHLDDVGGAEFLSVEWF
jgi:hypothetical protein